MRGMYRQRASGRNTGRDVAMVERLEPRQLLSAAISPVASALTPATPLGAKNPLTSIPVLNSMPGATAKIYLDFDGDPASDWLGTPVTATPAYDRDGDAATFSDSELDNIREIWSRVAEKYSPFNINVTTVNPGTLKHGETTRVVIGGDGAWYGSAGGVAYLGSFYTTYLPSTCYVFPDNLSNGRPKAVAEAAAHEAGHTFGLDHQSEYNGAAKVEEYYAGDGETAPIMGNSYTLRGTWWYGTSASYTTFQDDLVVLNNDSNGFYYRIDDHGSDRANADTFNLSGFSVSASGIIERMNDLDYFRFSTVSGPVSFAIAGAQYESMLHAKVEIRDLSDKVVLTAANPATMGQTISTTLPEGVYYLVVRSYGKYGDLGTYTITGTVQSYPEPTAHAGGPYTVNEGSGVILSAAASLGTGLSYAWDFDGDGIFGETGAGAWCGSEVGVAPTFSAGNLDGAGTRTISLRVTDRIGQTSTATAAVQVENVAPTATFIVPNADKGRPTVASFVSFTDPSPTDAVTLRFSYDWNNDGVFDVVDSPLPSQSHAFYRSGEHTVRGRIKDKDGAYADYTVVVTINNTAPLVVMSGAGTVAEGGSYRLSLGDPNDPMNDTIVGYTVDWGDGQTETFANGGVKTHTYGDDAETMHIVVSLLDVEQATATAGKDISVTKVAPRLQLVGAGSGLVRRDYVLGLQSSDPGQDTIASWSIDWGDGSPLTVTDGNPESLVHRYLAAGSFVVKATATDEDGTYNAGNTLWVNVTIPPSVISGAIYHDANGDGQRGAEEAGVAKWLVFLDKNRSGVYDTGDWYALTDASGNYSFSNVTPGDFRVVILPTVGWLPRQPASVHVDLSLLPGESALGQDFGVQQTGEVAGTLYNTSNPGVRTPLAQWRAFIDEDQDGAWDNGEKNMVTDQSGRYTFTGLLPGVYRVGVVKAGSNWVASTPAEGWLDVTVTAGTKLENQNLSFYQTASISGLVFNDASGEGTRASTEPALAGRQVFIDANKNGRLDAMEKVAVTDKTGRYTFAELAPGSYRVVSATPLGWRVSSAAAYYDVALMGGQVITAKDFGQTQKGLISGNVFNDLKKNGFKENTDPGLYNWRVFIDTDKDGVWDATEPSVLTDRSGNYCLKTVAAGTHRLRAVLAKGYRLITPKAGYASIIVRAGLSTAAPNFGAAI